MATLRIAVHPRYAAEVQRDTEKQEELVKCAQSFRYFLNYWHYMNQEKREDTVLGDLWPGQEEAVEAMEEAEKVFFLKARKLGLTTLEVAYCAWVLRFRGENERVHIFSRREDAAREFLSAIKYGLARLPEWMKLPYEKRTSLELILIGGPEDKRHVKSYPTSEETAVEATCTHAAIDEWARMKNPESVWQAIEPSLAGSAHILTTGRGPANFASIYWRLCESGDTEFAPIFIDAMARPDRDRHWWDAMVRGKTEEARRQEFPLTAQDAMYGGGEFQFPSEIVTPAGRGVGSTEPQEGHRYVKSWDIGRHKDAAVGTVIDVSAQPVPQVVAYIRMRGVPFPVLQNRVEKIHEAYPGPTIIEKNGPGQAVAENLNFPEDERHGWQLFWTGAQSKPRILEMLVLVLEQGALRWSASEWPQLDAEMRNYQIPDDDIIQDSVMSLAIANAHVNTAIRQGAGKLGKPILVS